MRNLFFESTFQCNFQKTRHVVKKVNASNYLFLFSKAFQKSNTLFPRDLSSAVKSGALQRALPIGGSLISDDALIGRTGAHERRATCL